MEEVEDLADLEEADLVDGGLNRIERRRLQNAITASGLVRALRLPPPCWVSIGWDGVSPVRASACKMSDNSRVCSGRYRRAGGICGE